MVGRKRAGSGAGVVVGGGVEGCDGASIEDGRTQTGKTKKEE
jgi:hypothetical protein